MGISPETQELETTQIWTIDAQNRILEPNKWHILPTYRLQLTLFHLARTHKPSKRTTTIRCDFAGWDLANEAALQLAKACRGEGESVMLVSRNEGEIDLLHQYAVGSWNWENDGSVRVPCKWSLILDFERERLYGHKKGDLSAYVQVVRLWKSPVLTLGEERAAEELQSANEQGKPPPSLGVAAMYQFGRYRVRDTSAWQCLVTTTPKDRLRREELEDLSMVFANVTLSQLPCDAWRCRNVSNTISRLEDNVGKLQLLQQQLQHTKILHNMITISIENPTNISWRLSKQSVVAKDLLTFEEKISFLRHLPAGLSTTCPTYGRPDGVISPSTTKNSKPLSSIQSTEPADEISNGVVPISSTAPSTTPQHDLASPSHYTSSIALVSALVQRCISTFIEALCRFAGYASLPERGGQENPTHMQKRVDPNNCNHNTHRWRRENFPKHKPLPFLEKSASEPMDQKLTPRWAQDPTYIPRCGQHFIPEKQPYPVPTTLCGYIRRQLETGWPVPREAYIRFGVMTEEGCGTRWGPDWRLQCEIDQDKWDHDRNVRRSRRQRSEIKTTAYPGKELDGYWGCLLEHEKR